MRKFNGSNGLPKKELSLLKMKPDVVEPSVTGVFLAAADGQITEINQCVCEMFGYTRDEMLGLFIEDLIQKDDLKQNPLQTEELKVGNINIAERHLKRKDRSVFVAEIQGQKLPGGLILGILHDKTEKIETGEALRLAEKSIRASEEKYRLLHEYSGFGVGYYTPQGVVISFNHVAAGNMNGKPEDFAGKSIYDLFPKEAADVYMSRLERAARSQFPQEYEDKIDLPVGTKWFVSTYSRIMDSENRLVGIQIISVNITDRKLAEAALSESEERYRRLYERSPLPYQSLDANGNFIEVNQAWLETLGYSREEVIGHCFGEFLLPETVEAFHQRFPCFKADGEIHNQVQMVHKDGHIIIIDIDGKIGYDAVGNFKQTHCVLRDITEQQRLQDALKDSEERYRTVADFTIDWETWIDPEGNYVYCSPAFEQITGYPPERFIEAPKFLFSLVYADDREIVEEHFALDKTDYKESTLLYRIHRNDGQVRWIEHKCRPVFSKIGSFLGIRGSNRDVTHRKLAEKALLESEARYRRLTDHAPDIIFRYDLNPTMKLAYINPAVQTITGYSPGECTADPDLMLNMIHPDDRDQMSAMLQDLNVPEDGFTLRWVGKDGVTRWMESRIVPVRDETGRLLAVEGITRDLTDRITADNALKTSEHFLARAQKISKLGSWTVDVSTNELTWSDGLYEIYGWERKEDDNYVDMWLQTVHPEDKERTMAFDKKVRSGEGGYDIEHRIIRHDNQEVRIINATAELV
ncbi:PAS domain S-box protein, partial [bacterium]|nr:PAS domain S-box protein [bacterium]MBU1024694.1 PAS domain S-box protein [bacterium]